MRTHWKLIGICLVAGLLGMGLAEGIGKVWYYAKVVRTVERILKSQHVDFSW